MSQTHRKIWALAKEGLCSIDQGMRELHAKLHTSGHLISNIIEKLYPNWTAIKGHHFPDQPYVEFISKKESSENIPLELVNGHIKQAIEEDLLTYRDEISGNNLQERCPTITYSIPSDQPIRIVRIGDFPFSPCGGTHVKSLGELKGLEVTKCRVKNKTMKINYLIHAN